MLWLLLLTKLPLLLSIDINECELETDNCHINADCTDTIGSFECTCNSGFEGDGVNCTSTSHSWKCHYYFSVYSFIIININSIQISMSVHQTTTVMRMPSAMITLEVTIAAVTLAMRGKDSTAQVGYNLHCTLHNGKLSS